MAVKDTHPTFTHKSERNSACVFVSLQSGAILVDPHIFKECLCVFLRVRVRVRVIQLCRDQDMNRFVLAPVSPLHFVKIWSALLLLLK